MIEIDNNLFTLILTTIFFFVGILAEKREFFLFFLAADGIRTRTSWLQAKSSKNIKNKSEDFRYNNSQKNYFKSTGL